MTTIFQSLIRRKKVNTNVESVIKPNILTKAASSSESNKKVGLTGTNVKTYKDIWALLHFKISEMKKAGITEINLDDILAKMKKLEGKTVGYN